MYENLRILQMLTNIVKVRAGLLTRVLGPDHPEVLRLRELARESEALVSVVSQSTLRARGKTD